MEVQFNAYVQLHMEVLRFATQLRGIELSVLLYLCSRVDHLARCFPSVSTIARETDHADSKVYEALDYLIANNWIACLRRAERDILTGMWVPNVYQVNPTFVNLNPKHRPQAEILYKNGGGVLDCPTVHKGSEREGISPVGETKQQQKQHQETTYKKQHTETTTTTAKSPFEGDKSEEQKAPTSDLTSEEIPTSTTAKQKRAKRSAPPVDPAVKFVSPPLVYEPLDPTKETLVKTLANIQIAEPLARGFINEYGYDHVQTAYYITIAEHRDRPSGFFRYVLQNKLIVAPTVKKKDLEPTYESYAVSPDRLKELEEREYKNWLDDVKRQTGLSEKQIKSLSKENINATLRTIRENLPFGWLKKQQEKGDITPVLISIFGNSYTHSSVMIENMIRDYLKEKANA